MTKFSVVNIIARGKLDRQIDLAALKKDIELPEVYIKGPGLYFKLDEDSPTVTLARSGKYIITGCTSAEEVENEHERTLNYLTSINLLQCPNDEFFEIVNVVATCELEHQLDLGKLVIALGLERTEYEPEQFPGVIFRPDEVDAVLLLFNSGKVVITGSNSIKEARKSKSILIKSISNSYL